MSLLSNITLNSSLNLSLFNLSSNSENWRIMWDSSLGLPVHITMHCPFHLPPTVQRCTAPVPLHSLPPLLSVCNSIEFSCLPIHPLTNGSQHERFLSSWGHLGTFFPQMNWIFILLQDGDSGPREGQGAAVEAYLWAYLFATTGPGQRGVE